jgi:hypothetical protein
MAQRGSSSDDVNPHVGPVQMAREPLRGRHWQQKSACTPSASVLGALQFSEEFSLPGVSPDSHW